jgi:ubiquinone/menaquinone biosynthesis C-methylase UbiE
MRKPGSGMRARLLQGGLDLRQASVEQLPFGDASFDAAMTINSMQMWPEKLAGLGEIARVLRPGGRIALGFTAHSGQQRDEVVPALEAAGFSEPRLLDVKGGFCVLASKP